MYLPYHPSVLRALKKIVTAAERFGKEVTVCGDMANDERYIAGLVGLGFRKLSLDARYIPAAQNRLAQIRIDQWQLKAAQMLQARTVEALTPFVRME
jgi:phosphotransferase system enzyme I (PtsI)